MFSHTPFLHILARTDIFPIPDRNNHVHNGMFPDILNHNGLWDRLMYTSHQSNLSFIKHSNEPFCHLAIRPSARPSVCAAVRVCASAFIRRPSHFVCYVMDLYERLTKLSTLLLQYLTELVIKWQCRAIQQGWSRLPSKSVLDGIQRRKPISCRMSVIF